MVEATIIATKLFALKPAVPAGSVNIAMTITMPTKVCSSTTAMAVTAKITKKTTWVGIPRTWANSSSNAVASICS